MSKKHCYFCNTCKLYFKGTSPDPETVAAWCPVCGKRLILTLSGDLEDTTKKLCLSKNEIGLLPVTYTVVGAGN